MQTKPVFPQGLLGVDKNILKYQKGITSKDPYFPNRKIAIPFAYTDAEFVMSMKTRTAEQIILGLSLYPYITACHTTKDLTLTLMERLFNNQSTVKRYLEFCK